MNGRCAICGVHIRSKRSKTYCTRHYWKLRRLSEMSEVELQQIIDKTEDTRRTIIVVLGKRTDDDVVEVQR